MEDKPLHLVAAEGRTVLQEDGRPWPVKGMEDPQTLFTRRRLADGDLVEGQPEAEEAAPIEDAAATTKPKKPETK